MASWIAAESVSVVLSVKFKPEAMMGVGWREKEVGWKGYKKDEEVIVECQLGRGSQERGG